MRLYLREGGGAGRGGGEGAYRDIDETHSSLDLRSRYTDELIYVPHFACYISVFSVRRFVEGKICRNFAHCFV